MASFCSDSDNCHADILLEIANGKGYGSMTNTAASVQSLHGF